MTTEKLEELIKQEENPKLDFKRDYELKKEKSEYVKDILALANGNKEYIGEPAYLIFGVIEHKNKENEIVGINIEKDKQNIQRELITHVNNHIEIPIQSLEVNEYNINLKRILYIKIPFQDYLLILKKNLKDTSYKKGNLLYRVGDNTLFKEESYDCNFRKAFEEAIEKYREQEKNKETSKQLKTLELFKPKREINEEYGSYLNKKDKVSLYASFPILNNYESRFTIECEIVFIVENSNETKITVLEEEVLEKLFSGYKSKNYKKSRDWILYFDKKNKLYTIQISSSTINISFETVKIVSEMLDDLQKIYTSKLSAIEDRLNSKSFPFSKKYKSGFELCRIDLSLWKQVQKFIVSHDKFTKKGDWNIFNASSPHAVRDIIVYENQSNQIIIRFSFEIDDSDILEPKIILIWNTLMYERLDTPNFYSVSEAYDWLIHKFIPRVEEDFDRTKKNNMLKWFTKRASNTQLNIESFKLEKENNLLAISEELTSYFYGKNIEISKNILKDLYEGLILIFEHSQNFSSYNYLSTKFSSIGNTQTVKSDKWYLITNPKKEDFIKYLKVELEEINKGDMSIDELLWQDTIDHTLRCCTFIMRENMDSYSDMIIFDIKEKLKGIIEIYDILKIREKRLESFL